MGIVHVTRDLVVLDSYPDSYPHEKGRVTYLSYTALLDVTS